MNAFSKCFHLAAHFEIERDAGAKRFSFELSRLLMIILWNLAGAVCKKIYKIYTRNTLLMTF